MTTDLAGVVGGLRYAAWRERVESTGGCLHPIQLRGSQTITAAATGAVIGSRTGLVFAACGTRREAVCPSCAARYAADAWHLIADGMTGGRTVPETVSAAPRVFATLTAPSFGAVHNRPGRRPCGCGHWHAENDPILGSPIDPSTYDYTGAVLWQAHAGALWHRATIAVRRRLAEAGGLTVRASGAHFRLAYAKVAEYQRRGLVHFHAVIRVDGADGPGTAAPVWLTPDVLASAVKAAAASVTLDTTRPDGQLLTLAWGRQVDVRDITTAADTPGGDGMSDRALAGYIAKYATKGTGSTASGVDRRIRSQVDIDHLRGVSTHHRQMMQTAWDLGGLDTYEELNLRLWAHMLAFRGHFLTKSRRYSTTFMALRNKRRLWRLTQVAENTGLDPSGIVVVNDWTFQRAGFNSRAEYELAEAISTRLVSTTHRKD